MQGQLHQCVVDSGASLSLLKPGVSQTEVRPTNAAAREISGTKLKSSGNQIIEIKLGNRIYKHEFLITPLDVEYSGVLRLHILRLMETKVDLCSEGLIIGRRRHELTGLDCPNRDSSPVIVMKAVVDEGRGTSGLITPKVAARDVRTTGKLCAGGPESLVRGELNPDRPVFHDLPNNTCSILASRLFILPPRYRVVIMGRIAGEGQRGEMPEAILVETKEVVCPGAYVARVVSDVFTGNENGFVTHHKLKYKCRI